MNEIIDIPHCSLHHDNGMRHLSNRYRLSSKLVSIYDTEVSIKPFKVHHQLKNRGNDSHECLFYLSRFDNFSFSCVKNTCDAVCTSMWHNSKTHLNETKGGSSPSSTPVCRVLMILERHLASNLFSLILQSN